MRLTKDFKFDVKAKDAAGQFSGRASVYGVVDAHNDVVMPGAFAKHLADSGSEIKVLNQHNPYDVIGKAILSDSDTALLADGQLVLDLASAKEAHVRLMSGLLDGISIGYEVTGETFNKGVRELHEVKLWEISLCTFPANTFARVTDVKHIAPLGIDGMYAEMFEMTREVKAGRVLSGANMNRLKQLIALAQELLVAAEPEEDEKSRGAKELLASLRGLTASMKAA